jgi:hypothetical protein
VRFRAIPSVCLFRDPAYRDAPFAQLSADGARLQACDVEDFCGLGRGLFEIVNVQNCLDG